MSLSIVTLVSWFGRVCDVIREAVTNPVLIVTSIVWLGLFAYLWTLSRQLEQLRRKQDGTE